MDGPTAATPPIPGVIPRPPHEPRPQAPQGFNSKSLVVLHSARTWVAWPASGLIRFWGQAGTGAMHGSKGAPGNFSALPAMRGDR